MKSLDSSLPEVLAPIVERVERANRRRRARIGVPTSRPCPERRAAFRGALSQPGVSLIAESKRRSPSEGAYVGAEEITGRVACYELGGAAVASILTEPYSFDGRRAHLSRASRRASLPILRKDFVLDPEMVDESQAMGASCVLLIARVLVPEDLIACAQRARELGLASLVEIHSRTELAAALAAKPDAIGVNARDLDTLRINSDRALELLAEIPEGPFRIAESGLSTPAELSPVAEVGADGALVGSALMRAADPRSAAACFARAGRGESGFVPLGELPISSAIKVCGLTRPQDVAAAREAGADLFGFVLEPTSSPRAVDLERAGALVAEIPDGRSVLVTTEARPEEVLRAAASTGASIVQLCGPCEPAGFADFPLPLLRAVAADDPEELDVWKLFAAGFVIEPAGSLGGSGRTVEPSAVARLLGGNRCLVAGGLGPHNVGALAHQLGRAGAVNFGVDASSSLEDAPGIKRRELVAAYVRAARAALGSPEDHNPKAEDQLCS